MIQQIRRSPAFSLLLNRQLLSLSFGHFSVDMYANLLPMMYPMLVAALGLDYSQVGLTVAMYTLSSSLSQPLFGYIADKVGGRHLAALGIAWTATLVALIGFAWDYWSLVTLVTIAGLGTAAFHPQGAMNTADVGGGRKASAMSIFMLGGNAGFSIGPMVGALVFSTSLGLHGATLLWLPGLAAALWVYRAIGKVDVRRQAIKAQKVADSRGVARVKVPVVGVAALVTVVMLRSWAASALTNYIPLLFSERGLSRTYAGQILFLALLSVAVGGLVGAFLADEFGGKKVTFASLAAAGPAIFLFFQSSELLMAVCAVAVGFLLGASTSVTLVMGQEMLPRSVGVASGLILGLGFATSGIGVGLTGALAEQIGLFEALNIIWILPLLAALFTLALKRPERELAEIAPGGW